MRMPVIDQRRQTRESVEQFYGYNHQEKINKAEFRDMRNMSGRHYPLLAPRKKRGEVRVITNPGGLIEKDALCSVEDGTLYVNGVATSVTGLSAGEKQLVGMGAYIVIFPDKVYYNTEDASDTGSLEASYAAGGTVNYYPCDVDGNVYEISEVSDTEPEVVTNGMIWADTSGSTTVFMQYSTAQAMWVSIPTVYTKIEFNSAGAIPALFRQYDGVSIAGTRFADDLDGEKILYGVGGKAASGNDEAVQDYVVVIGLITEASTGHEDAITIQRKIPKLDYVCECQNRLWGCYYGIDQGKVINEIYCCALGDFRNWRQYLGLATDSWTASIGSDGQWTGAVNYLGHPCFFKENRIHSVSVSSVGAHQIDETVCRGVQKGSWRSLQVVEETLYYKSRTDICAWQGGFPVCVSANLGDEKYSGAVAGSFGGRYYISMKDGSNAWHLFVYDTKKGFWHREDELHALCFCAVDDALYCVDAATGKLWDLNGTAGTPETEVEWMAESGILYYETVDRKYLSRFNIKVWLDEGAEMRILAEYDSDGVWHELGNVIRKGMGTTMLPVRPRRCDHLKLRLEGSGDMKLFSMTRILEAGSDYR